jgi:peptide/nickel transport system substrate-binding protein
MATRAQDELLQSLSEGTISRETFMRRAGAAGLSAATIAAFLGTGDDAAASSARQPRAKALPRASAARTKTVIFSVDTGPIPAYQLFNHLVPGQQTQSMGLHQCVIEPLFIFNYGNGKIDPWLAESYTVNKTQDVWTIKLRQGIMWSDGQPMTADDVVFTLDMLRSAPATIKYSGPMKEWIKSLKKIDDLTTEITLTKPNPRFLLTYLSVTLFDAIYVLPKHIWQGQDPEKFTNYDPAKGWPVYSGPYKLVTATPTQFLYQRDPNWWGAKAAWMSLPAPEYLMWEADATEDVRVAKMAARQADSLADITTGGYLALKAKNPNVIAWYPGPPYAWADPCMREISINCAVPPWNDKDLRWALSLAIQRDQVVNIAYENSTIPAKFIFPAYPPLNRYVHLLEQRGVFAKYPSGSYNPAKAQQILESKGYKKGGNGYFADSKGNLLSLDIITHSDIVELKRLAQVVVQQLQNFGINAAMPILANNPWFNAISYGQYQAASCWNACGSVAEPWTSLDNFNIRWVVPVGQPAGAFGYAFRWKNKKYSELVDTLGTLPLNDPRGDELFVEAATIWLSELPAVPVTQAKKLVPFDTTYWTGWPTAANYYNHPGMWWGSAHEVIHRLKPAKM